MNLAQVRKCMSVILRRESGEVVLLTKGAESSILPKCPQDEVSCLNNQKFYRVDQLNLTPEMEVFYMLFDRSLSIFSTA